jgi:enoyl-CoA hydratase/carnithine racemase
MASTRLSVDIRDVAAWLRLEGEDGNALTPDLVDRIGDQLAALAEDGGVRVALLTGAGGAFCRGWDQSSLPTGDDPADVHRLSAAFQAIAEASLPVIAVIEGDALGAGLDLALACDIRLASDTARFGFPDGRDGLLPLGGGASRLARLAGHATALSMLLTGTPDDAAAALASGLVSAVYPPARLRAEAARLAGVIASRGPIAVRYAKEAVARGTDMPLDHALRYETDLTIILQSTADRAEGVAAFAEKRQPKFEGR